MNRAMLLLRSATIPTLAVVTALIAAYPRAGSTVPLRGAPDGAAAAAQSGRNLEPPPDWKARFDVGSGERGHVVMRPGWHVHPGPAGIFWDAGRRASGNYAISSTIFLFPAGSGDPPSTTEAPYGILFAGEDLESETPGYATFLVRNDGSFRVARHRGDAIDEVVRWTPHDAIATWSADTEGTAENVLGVDFTAAAVTFWVNDVQIASLERADVPAQGIVGLRAGDGLSLHVTDIVIGPNRR